MAKIIVHPKWSVATINYDIAVIHLETPFQADTNAAIIPLALSEPLSGSWANVTGWGQMSTGKMARFLQLANTTKIVNRADCQSKWKNAFTITPQMICAESVKQASCHGDSGKYILFLHFVY